MFGLLLVHSCRTGPVWCEGLDCWLWKNGIFLKNRNKFDVFSAFAHFLTVYMAQTPIQMDDSIIYKVLCIHYCSFLSLVTLSYFAGGPLDFFAAGDWSMPWATYLEALGSASHQDSHHHISVKDSKLSFDFSYSHTHWLIHHTHVWHTVTSKFDSSYSYCYLKKTPQFRLLRIYGFAGCSWVWYYRYTHYPSLYPQHIGHFNPAVTAAVAHSLRYYGGIFRSPFRILVSSRFDDVCFTFQNTRLDKAAP